MFAQPPPERSRAQRAGKCQIYPLIVMNREALTFSRVPSWEASRCTSSRREEPNACICTTRRASRRRESRPYARHLPILQNMHANVRTCRRSIVQVRRRRLHAGLPCLHTSCLTAQSQRRGTPMHSVPQRLTAWIHPRPSQDGSSVRARRTRPGDLLGLDELGGRDLRSKHDQQSCQKTARGQLCRVRTNLRSLGLVHWRTPIMPADSALSSATTRQSSCALSCSGQEMRRRASESPLKPSRSTSAIGQKRRRLPRQRSMQRLGEQSRRPNILPREKLRRATWATVRCRCDAVESASS
ncbi:hypothetical protein PYCCODRAFT_799552 [Trametes coccinea BRFM310]|uniref:Uncharacterized protein n=1 Tax=Trametes coccinea (strain BRFM310) TaxID=1353009 RepID=A0A1Y2IEQ6_TRAC3|nr:hypothetical protein PYCCODRAFT_799552 [Trametes coccinea BRFM310]